MLSKTSNKVTRKEAATMAKVKASSYSEPLPPMRPALNPDAREQQLISLAVDLVEKRLREGTASSQETVHFLKLATKKSRTENEVLELQKDLIAAKTDTLKSQKRSEEMFAEAMKAFRNYSGQGGDEEEYDDDEY
jgi:hypothetical protein